MSTLTRVLARLHRVFNKDPQTEPVITLTCPDGVDLAVSNLTLTGGTLAISLDGLALTDLVTAVNNVPGFSATLVSGADGTLLARGIVDDGAVSGTLRYPTSLFYQEMQTSSWSLQDQADRMLALELEMYMNTADEDWLDFWGRDIYGLPRFADENDGDYSQRITNELTRPTQNNVALAQIVKQALGADIVIRDAVPYVSELPVDQQADAPGRFLLDMSISNSLSTSDAQILIDKIKAIVNKYKAAGTDFIQTALLKAQKQTESVSVAESVEVTITATFSDQLSDGPIYYGAGWTFGTPGLKFGTNDAIKEQIRVQKIEVSTGHTVADYIYGG